MADGLINQETIDSIVQRFIFMDLTHGEIQPSIVISIYVYYWSIRTKDKLKEYEQVYVN